MKALLLVLLAGTITLSACGGSSSGSAAPIPATLSGNWQFTMENPPDGSFLQGGFLLQDNDTVTGSVAYATNTPGAPSSSGSAVIAGTITGQNVSFTATIGTQDLTFCGTLSFNGSTMAGFYTSGTASNGSSCGTTQSGLQWSAAFVPPLSGPVQGSFHSAGGAANLNEQDFLVSGALIQAANTGASSATVTGNLNFLNAITNLSDYPCLTVASVTGQISGNSVVLQMNGANGSNIGQIGSSPGSNLQAVTFDSTQNGYVVQSLSGVGYAVYAAACGGGSLNSPADSGNLCLAVNGTTACQQPVTFTPPALIFPSQGVGSPPTTQTITLANTYGSSLSGLTFSLTNNSGPGNFSEETDTCGVDGAPALLNEPFVLLAKQSCTITIAFAPQEGCAPGTSAAKCLTATLTLASPTNDEIFTMPITGGVTAGAGLTSEFDFGAERVSEASIPQWLSFTGHSGHPVQTLPDSSHRTFQDLEHHAEVD